VNLAELVSKKTRTEFCEFLVGWTLREIGDEFEAAGITADQNYQPPLSGQRRWYVEQFYHTLDFANPADVDRLLKVYENILTHGYTSLRSGAEIYDMKTYRASLDQLVAWLRRDGYAYEDSRLVPIGHAASLRQLKAKAVDFDASYLSVQIGRIESAVATDPDLAIGQAKELIETCCKTILHEHGVQGADKLDVPALARRTMEVLQLVPEGISDTAKGSKTIKSVLGNLATVVQGLAELRNLYGTGHGKHGRTKGLQPRHARLAAGAAATLATFLLDTHVEKNR
jgi:hypothetical protein